MIALKLTLPTIALRRIPFRVNRAVRAGAVKGLELGDRAIGNAAGMQVSTQGGHLGTTWKELRQATVKARAKKWGYYKRASGSGSRRPIGVWTGGLRVELFTKGRLFTQKLSVQRVYTMSGAPRRNPRARVVLLHGGVTRTRQAPRPIFRMAPGNPMTRAATSSFAKGFELSFHADVRRP